MLERIERHDATLNTFITVLADDALVQAERADAELASGKDRGALHGIPIALKDLIATAGIRTTAGSAVFDQWVPEQDAAVVERLRQAGAVVLGKTGLHELAYGTTSDNAFFGPVMNPWATDHLAGGSSGGSAAAVAAGLAYAAIGTDTGCSIRQPAHCCGIVGFKPTFGAVSKAGVVPLCWSMDHVGPMARSVDDARLVLQAIAGFDADDPYSARERLDWTPSATPPLDSLRLGVVRRHFFSGDDDVIAAVDTALGRLSARGAQIVSLDLPEVASACDASRAIFAESLAIYQDDLRARPDAFGQEVRDKLVSAMSLSAVDYAQAQHLRQQFSRQVERLFEHCDVLCAPVAASSAIPLADQPDGHARKAWKNTILFDFSGHPSVSVPCGLTATGLPVGLMLTGKLFGDVALARYAAVIESTLPAIGTPPGY